MKAGLGTTKSVRSESYSFPNISLDGWEGLKAYTFEKRQSKSAHFSKISRRASRGAAWPLHFKFASYAYVYIGQFSIKKKKGW